MSKRIQLRRGTASENSSFKGAVGEVTVDTTNKTLRVHDGTTVGGTALARANQLAVSASQVTAGLIEIATQTEVNAGTDSTRAIVPNTLLGGMKTHLNASGTTPMYACRAWVNFNGTGTVAIRGSGNVSSITDNGVGDYTVNFSTAMQDSNYCVTGALAKNNNTADANSNTGSPGINNLSLTSFRVITGSPGDSGNVGLAFDAEFVHLSVFR